MVEEVTTVTPTEEGGADGAAGMNTHYSTTSNVSLTHLSPHVIAVTVLLTPLLPAELETVTVMVYLLPGSSPVIV